MAVQSAPRGQINTGNELPNGGEEWEAQGVPHELTFGNYNAQHLSLEPEALKCRWCHIRAEAPVGILAVQDVMWP